MIVENASAQMTVTGGGRSDTYGGPLIPSKRPQEVDPRPVSTAIYKIGVPKEGTYWA
jgi:hypothetical protein